MAEPIIRIRNMSIIYNKGKDNEFRASDGINMEIYPGEYIIFFGPSGCGKSTALYSILGILQPTSGEVIVKGEDIYEYTANDMVRYQTEVIGIMYQAFYLIPSLTIADNVTLPMIFQGVHPTIRRQKAEELLERFGVGMHAHKLPEALSGGQIQRVSVARSFINDPEIILADEPVGNLDSVSADAVMNTLDEINRRDKKTIILVTHDAKYLPYAHRIIYIRDGRVVRIVPNPEKKQIARVDKQKSMVTEMEQLVKIHPYLSASELKVKSMINYLTQDLNFEQIIRLENFAKLMIDGKVDDERFYNNLTTDFKKGGVGLDAKQGKEMTAKIAKLLSQSKDFRRYRRRMDENNFFNKGNELIKHITSHLVEAYGHKLEKIAQKNLTELVYGRVSGLIKKDEFVDGLMNELKEKGVGMNKEMAFAVTQYFEKLLTAGLEVEDRAAH
ncbi:MAG: ABC transporter ATP-binding protein [bacterium]